MSQLIRELPKEIRDVLIERMREEHPSRNLEYYLKENPDITVTAAITFNETPEENIWYQVNDGEYKSFYEMYPHLKKPTIIETYQLY